MAGRRSLRLSMRSGWVRVAAVACTAALLVGAAVIVNGFDVKQTPVNDSSVWALQNGGGNRYARVNTDLGEIDTVKAVRSPSSLVQTDSSVLLFAQNNEKMVDVSLAEPVDLSDDSTEYRSTPSGTVTVVSTGSWVGYLTAGGGVFAAPSGMKADTAPTQLDPNADDAEQADAGEKRAAYRADSIAIGTDGILYSYSVDDGTVVRFDLETMDVAGTDTVPGAPEDQKTQLTAVGDTWVLLDAAGETLWVDGRDEPVETGLSALAVLQRPSADGTLVHAADDAGLVSVDLTDGTVDQVVGGGKTPLGIPAPPASAEGELYAAWLPATGTAGTLWSSADGEQPLSYGTATSNGDPVPVFQSSGSRMILNDTGSGWIWTVPDGALVAGSQDWALASREAPRQDSNVEKASVVVDPKAPVAEADAFGVRVASLVQLPVLLNDHDANEDVLTVVPASVTGLNADFGTLTVTDQSQSIVVQVAPGAQGTATFSYSVTDGTRSDGLVSPPATVTLTVHDAGTNEAPVWCGTAGCLQNWPEPQVQPGGLTSVTVLPGWVDPDGDPIFVSGAVNTTGIGSVSATPAGTVVYKHPNPDEANPQPVSVDVQVSDVNGATATKTLAIQVTPTPKLTVEPFARLASVGEHVTVDPAEHVSGAAGAWSIVSASTPPASEGSTETVNSGGATFDFVATAPGSYLVSLSLADELSTVISLVRVTVVEPLSSPLGTAPVSVFVRPKLDTSVDVFTAVSHPAGLVLLLSDAVPNQVDGATLDVDVVGQTILRVRGTSGDEQPGKLGTVRYTVSDGTGNPAASVQGEATVYLLPQSVPQAPIAVADQAVVRAGAQVDLPVLDNDVAPDGNVLVLNAESVQNPSGLGLAFASSSSLRYLAPAEAGTYELRYTISVTGSAELTDTATVTIEVLADGQNRAPQPRVLTGRVLAGDSVEIPFDSYAIDPDGDAVLLDRVMTQPKSGTAALTAAGDAIVYTSVAGATGAVDFTYRVRDSFGETATALVRIGVLDQTTNPRPITFTDYVEVTAGGDNQVIVYPTKNDIEPAGAALTITDVAPDAIAGTAEHDTLAERIGAVDDGTVVLTAGDQPGTMTFVYSVTNPNGDVGVGLIVLKVVRSSVLDFPVVSDTVVSVQERAKLAKGLDVVTGKVSWASGDVSGLKLKLWGDPQGMKASGWKISGEASDAGLLLPFSLTGTNFEGVEVTTYGFLRLPAKDAVIVALNAGDATQKVKEGASVTFDLARMITIPGGDTLEIDRTGVTGSGQRAEGECALSSGTAVTYTAGKGAPWADYCTVPARFSGQADFTQLLVPIVVEALDPQPELRAASLTQSPGTAAITFDLRKMATWPGHTDLSALTFDVGTAGDLFVVEQSGATLSITTADTAVPGREVAVAVSLASHPETAAAVLSLKVGPAPSTLPKGGTVARACSASAGSNCTIEVIGTPGEVNIYESTALSVVSVSATGACTGVSFAVADDRNVSASWPADAAGGTCQASFVVRDAQGRESAGDRNGSVSVDLQGYPRAPNSVTQVAYGDKSVTLSVSPGAATAAYPGLQGFTITQNGQEVATCDASGSCGAITTGGNGDQRTYEARAFNAEGKSSGSVSTTAWSYANPGMGQLKAESVYDQALTGAGTGAVDVTIENTDDSARSYQVNGQDVARSPLATTVVRLSVPVGGQTVSVTPLSRYEPPLQTGAGTAARTVDVVAAGSPLVSSAGTLAPTPSSITVNNFALNANSSTRPLQFLYAAYQGKAPTCAVDATGGNLVMVGAVGTPSPTVSGLRKNKTYTVVVCASNGYGFSQTDVGQALTWSAPDAPGDGTYTYQVTTAKSGQEYTVTGEPTSAVAVPEDFAPVFAGYPSGVWGADPGLTVKYCLISDASLCGPSSKVTALVPTRAWQARVDAVAVATCQVGSPLKFAVTGQATDTAVATAVTAWYFIPTVIDPNAPVDPAAPPAPEGTWTKTTGATVPATATRVRNAAWSLAWSGAATSGLEGFTGSTGSDSAPGTETVCR